MQDNNRSGFVYVIQDGSGLCKIGRARNVDNRIRSLSTGSSSELTLIAAWRCEDAGAVESSLHESWGDVRIRGEWFRIPDETLQSWRSAVSPPVGQRQPSGAVTRSMRPDPAMPKNDGHWWMSDGSQRIVCGRCKRNTDDHPAVMAYRKKFDWGGEQARCYPDWPTLGWVVWRQCEFCSWMDFKTEYVTTEQIRVWAIGPWRPMS